MRLTNQIRREIRDALIERRFKEESESLKKDFCALGDDYYFSMFTAAQRTLLASCPANWFQEASEMQAKYQTRFCCIPFSETKMLPQFLCHNREELPPLYAKRLAKLRERYAELDKKRDEASQQIIGVLKSVSTTETLLRTWPEIAAHVPSQVPPPTCALAIPLKQLNASLRLP